MNDDSFINLPDGRIRVIDHDEVIYGHISFITGTGYVYKPFSIYHPQYIMKMVWERLLKLTLEGE